MWLLLIRLYWDCGVLETQKTQDSNERFLTAESFMDTQVGNPEMTDRNPQSPRKTRPRSITPHQAITPWRRKTTPQLSL